VVPPLPVPSLPSIPVFVSACAFPAEGCWPGIARQQVTFFCFAKRKSPKKRRPAVWVPALRYGQPAVLEPSGVRLNSLRSDNAGPDPLVSALLGPARTGQSGAGTKTNKDSPRRVLVSSGIGIPSPTLVDAPRSAGPDGSGIALFERSEFSETPSGPSTAGCPQRSGGTQQPGSPFLLLTFLLAKQKKSELPPGNPRPATLSKERPAGKQKEALTQEPPSCA